MSGRQDIIIPGHAVGHALPVIFSQLFFGHNSSHQLETAASIFHAAASRAGAGAVAGR
jgi:hypothetical protein